MLNQDQIERLAEAIEGAAKKAGFEWLDDSYTESLHLPPGETPYTHGCGLITDLASELGELLVKVRAR